MCKQYIYIFDYGYGYITTGIYIYMYIYINVYGYGYIGYINVYNLSKLYNPTNKYMSYTNKLCG